jgi:sulfocyanin SoxE-like protein
MILRLSSVAGAAAAVLAAFIHYADGSARTDPVIGHASPDTLAWLQSDSAARTVLLRLQVTRPPSAPSALINGHRAGDIQIVVPLGWTVRWEWRSADSNSTHSLVVMAEREKLPAEGGRPAFDNAMTRMVTSGLAPGQDDRTTFTADQPGWFWMLCGMPGHAIEGEFIGLRVDPAAKTGGVKVVRK